MARISNVIIGMIGVAYCTPAAASNWQLAATGADNVKIYVDMDTVIKVGDSAMAWTKWDYSAAKIDPKRAYIMEKDKSRYDCARRTTKLLYAVEYNSDATVRKTYDLSDMDSAPGELSPGSVGEAVLNLVCGSNVPPPG